jgi:CRISPR-associated protein Cas1
LHFTSIVIFPMSTQISGGDLKSILLSKRANLYYLEFCRVLCNGGRVEFVTES